MSQNEGVHKRLGIHSVKRCAFQSASLFRDDLVVIVGIGICDTAAARRHARQVAFVERLERHQKEARSPPLLRVIQLLTTAELACSNMVPHFGDQHRDSGPGLRCTRDLDTMGALSQTPCSTCARVRPDGKQSLRTVAHDGVLTFYPGRHHYPRHRQNNRAQE